MQSKWVRPLLAVAALGLTAACENIHGMTETLTSYGPVSQPPPQALNDVAVTPSPGCTLRPATQDQFGLFQVSYYCAWRRAYWTASGALEVDDPETQKAYKNMLREGIGLVRSNCNDFFRRRGDNQQQISLGRDVVAMGGTAAAAIIGLTGGSALALSIIAVAGATLYSGIDTYTKNFLFGADNIEAVRTLTLETLDANANTALNTPGTFGFQNVAATIMNNQEICKPASIAAAVRIKIRSGGGSGIQAYGEDASARAQLDSARMLTIAARLGLPGGVAISETRLAAACWATTAEGMAPSNLEVIKTWLPKDPYAYGPDNPTTWPGTSAVVANECQAMSGTMQNVIKARIAELKPKATGAAASAPPPAAAAAAAPAVLGGVPRETRPVRTVQPPAPPPSGSGALGPAFIPMRVQ